VLCSKIGKIPYIVSVEMPHTHHNHGTPMHLFRFALLTGLIIGAASCTHSAPSDGITLTILHTNDMHAQYLPHEATWVKSAPHPLIGGFVRLAEVLDSLREAHRSTVTLDAGDVMTGNPISDRPFKGAQGGLLIDFMNQLGYDAWSPGNHEFDISQANMRALVHAAAFPSLAANLADSTGEQYDGTTPYTILNRGGLRIGVIGLISQRLSSLVLQQNLTGIRVFDPAEILQRWITELDPVTDLLIAVTHQGYEADSILAGEITGLDVIVGGHSHTRLREPHDVNGVLIVQAGSSCEYLGELTVTVENDRIRSYRGHLIPLWVVRPAGESPLERMVDSVRTVIEGEYGQVVMTLSEPMPRHDPGQRLALAITEAQRIAASAQVAFMNRGGIRRDLDAGPVTRNDLYEVLPFRNVLGTFQLRGGEMRDLLTYVLSKETDVVFTGLSVEWTRSANREVKLLRVLVGGVPLEEDRAYRCVASDYFLSQFSRYCGLDEPRASYSTLTVSEAVEKAFRQEDFLERVPQLGIRERRGSD
jgi:2',3'-cyclic-nucleotide 2'-phosphodiesterase (5'-nucleotidase family)